MLWVIAYDIPDDGRRTKLAKLMESYGDRVQYSVFEAELNEKHIRILKKRIEEIIDIDQDSVRIYRICADCKDEINLLGIGKLYELDRVFIV
ncbi:CRISPR-associated endonuclease Cas2 [bacterium]|nr:MAG: CRISPR-associated endonuclease Cas2 [bacterium]